jgi:hypothetical protein
VKPVPKKKQTGLPDEQSKRFVAEAQRMIDAGELNPTEADEAFERLMNGMLRPSTSPSAGCGD